MSSEITKLRFDKKSFFIFLLIFLAEVIIALFLYDPIIRPYAGDILVVMLIYYFIKSFLQTNPLYIAVGVLLFAYLVEFGQYIKLIEIFNLQDNKLARVIIGTSFSWIDMLCYTIGAIICIVIDRKKIRKTI